MALDKVDNILDRLSKTLVILTGVGALIAFPFSIIEWDGVGIAIWALFALMPTSVYLFLVWLLTGKLIQNKGDKL